MLPTALTRLGSPVHTGLPRPPTSAFRVWLPSARLTPSEPGPVFFRTGGALGIHPSELTPPARYRVVSGSVNPLTVFPAVASVAGATGRPGRPRFLGFDPRENPWRSSTLVRVLRPLDAPLGFALPGFATDDWNGFRPVLLSRAFLHAPGSALAAPQSLNRRPSGPETCCGKPQ